MPQSTFEPIAEPVAAADARIVEVGINPLDRRRLDVAVDLTPCREPLTVEMVVVGPRDSEVCSVTLIGHRGSTIDKVLHLRSDAEPGDHFLHIGLFQDKTLVAHAQRRFAYPQEELGPS